MGGFLGFGGQGGLPPQQQAPYRRGSDDVQGTDLVAVMRQMEEEKRKRQAQGLLTLVGLAALSNGMDNGQLTMDNGGKKTGGGPGKAGGPVKDAGGMAGAVKLLGGGAAPGVTGTAKAGGRSRRDSGAAAGKSASGGSAPLRASDPAADASKIFPLAMMGAGAGAASGGAGLLSSPVLGASVAGGAALLDGVIGGDGGQEEMAKKQLKTGRQESLFGAVAAMTDNLRRRNEERRAAWGAR